MALIRISGGHAMAAHYLGYGKRLQGITHRDRNGKKGSTLLYEIDDASPEFALILEQAQEWRNKGNVNMRKNNAAVRDEVKSLREIVERLISSQARHEPSKANGEAAPVVVAPPLPEAPPAPPRRPQRPPDMERTPVGSVWRTKSWNSPRGPRWLEVEKVWLDLDGKSMASVTLLGGKRRHLTMESSTMLTHWVRQDDKTYTEADD